MRTKNKYIALFTILIVGAVIFSCTGKKPKVPKDQILAKVGDRIITAEEFRISFEFSPAPLRFSVDPKRAYLDYMIKELLMANQGYKLGLNKTRYVTSRLQRRRYNDLLEAFYLKHVHGKVKIPDEEIEEALKKSTVKWRMIIWPTPSYEEAKKAQLEAVKTDLNDYIDKQIAAREMPLTDKRIFETDWVDFLDMPPEVLEKVVDVEMGVPSEPFPYNDGYAIAQVLDIQRQGITEDELKFGPKRKKIERRLHDIKADKIVRTLMDSIITPLDVRVKGLVVEDLSMPLYQWFQDGLPERKSLFDPLQQAPDSRPYLQAINNMLDKTLATSGKGNYSVRDFLEYTDYYRKALNQSASFEDFQNRLITEIGRMIKNDVFVSIAEKEGFDDSLNISEDLRQWEQKWTYDMYRHRIVKEIKVSEDEAREFFKTRWRELDIADVDTTRFYEYKNAVYNAVLHEKQLAQIEEDLEELRKKYPVWINEELLDAITVVDSLPTSQKTYFLRKNFTFEAYSPTVDMKWLGF